MESEKVTWSLESDVIGVSVNESTGVVTVADSTSVGSFNLVAKSNTDAEVKATKTVNVTVEEVSQDQKDVNAVEEAIDKLTFTDLVIVDGAGGTDAAKKEAVTKVITDGIALENGNNLELNGVNYVVNEAGSEITLTKGSDGATATVTTGATFTLSEDAQAELDADAFKSTHATILAKTTGDVTITDKGDVSAAQRAFDNLSDPAKAKLDAGEKQLLLDLAGKIDKLEKSATLQSAEATINESEAVEVATSATTTINVSTIENNGTIVIGDDTYTVDSSFDLEALNTAIKSGVVATGTKDALVLTEKDGKNFTYSATKDGSKAIDTASGTTDNGVEVKEAEVTDGTLVLTFDKNVIAADSVTVNSQEIASEDVDVKDNVITLTLDKTKAKAIKSAIGNAVTLSGVTVEGGSIELDDVKIAKDTK